MKIRLSLIVFSDYVTYYPGSGAPITNAAIGGHVEIVNYLLERGAGPDLPEEGIAPRGHALHSAVVCEQTEIIKLLLEHGAPIQMLKLKVPPMGRQTRTQRNR